MKKPRHITAILISVAVTLALAWAFRPRATAVDIAPARRGELVERITVDGRLRSSERWTVSALADGEMRRISLEVGDGVRRGDRITDIFWDKNFEPLRAPVSGVVSKVFRESAGPVRRGDPLLELVDPEKLEVVAELLTPEAVQVSPGDPARVRGWGGADQEGDLEARVVRISRAGFTKPSALGVDEERTEVVLELQKPVKLGNDFHVEIEIETGRTPGALLIPIGAIFRDGARWATYIFVSGRAELRHLVVGRRNDESVEILSGLKAGQEVVVYPGELVRPGSKIKPS